MKITSFLFTTFSYGLLSINLPVYAQLPAAAISKAFGASFNQQLPNVAANQFKLTEEDNNDASQDTDTEENSAGADDEMSNNEPDTNDADNTNDNTSNSQDDNSDAVSDSPDPGVQDTSRST